MVEIKNVSKFFDGYCAISDININIKKGTIYGVIGENGAGKTTLIQCLTGIYKPDKGYILVEGEKVYENPDVKAKIGYVADSNSYFPYYKVKNLVKFFSQIYKTFSIDKFNELNKIFNIPENKRISQLSKGMQMRLSLMLNISINPKLLVLDEPTSGIDVIAKKQIIDILIEEVEKNDLTIFISSHHLSELEKLCDEISILNCGKIIYQDSVDLIKGKIKKLQVIFRQSPDLNNIEEIIDIQNVGCVYYIIVKEYDEEFKDKLKKCGAEVIEEIGMSLEEIFIYTNK